MGKRAGKGRPREMEDAVGMGIILTKTLTDRLDVLADSIGISRSQLIRNLLEVAVEDAEILNALGVFALTRWFDAMKEKMGERRAEIVQAC